MKTEYHNCTVETTVCSIWPDGCVGITQRVTYKDGKPDIVNMISIDENQVAEFVQELFVSAMKSIHLDEGYSHSNGGKNES